MRVQWAFGINQRVEIRRDPMLVHILAGYELIIMFSTYHGYLGYWVRRAEDGAASNQFWVAEQHLQAIPVTCPMCGDRVTKLCQATCPGRKCV